MSRSQVLTRFLAAALCCGFALASHAEEKAKETREVQAKDLKLVVPKSWKQEEPSNRLRITQFKIAPADGDKDPAELTISQAGGSVNDNLKRWVNQFQPKDRTVKITKGKSTQGEYFVVDVIGTYNKPDGPPIAGKTIPVGGQRMLAVMLQIEDKGSYFLKLNGAEKTVSGIAADLRSAIGVKADDENEFKLE